jgi:chitodextrinase
MLLVGPAANAAPAEAGRNAAVMPAAVPPSVTLLSQNHPVTVSSSGGCCPAKYAVDGKSTTRWASAPGIDPQWIVVDLGTPAAVTRVRLEWDTSCATAYQVQSSTDGTAFGTTLFSTTTGNGGVDDLTVSGTGRYIRVYATHRCRTSSTKGYSLREFQVYGYPIVIDQPPPPPTGLSVTFGCNSLTLTWTPSPDPDVVAYEVFRDGQFVGQTSVPRIVVTGLTGGFRYSFTVAAVDAAGNISQPSNPLSVMEPVCDPIPVAAPIDLHVVKLEPTCVTIGWTQPPVATFVAGYRIFSGTALVGTSTTTTFTICGLTPNTAYVFSVVAYTIAGNESPHSTPLTVVTPAA